MGHLQSVALTAVVYLAYATAIGIVIWRAVVFGLYLRDLLFAAVSLIAFVPIVHMLRAKPVRPAVECDRVRRPF
jgi:hypothetical protein